MSLSNAKNMSNDTSKNAPYTTKLNLKRDFNNHIMNVFIYKICLLI